MISFTPVHLLILTVYVPQALRILDNSCDSCLEDPTSYELWTNIEK